MLSSWKHHIPCVFKSLHTCGYTYRWVLLVQHRVCWHKIAINGQSNQSGEHHMEVDRAQLEQDFWHLSRR